MDAILNVFGVACFVTPLVLATAILFSVWCSSSKRQKTAALASVVFCLALSVILGIVTMHWLWKGHRGEANVEALLAGCQAVRLRSIEISGQQLKVRCVNPATLRYFEERFRRYEAPGNGGGITYTLRLRFEDGGEYRGYVYWADWGFSTYFGVEPGDGPTTHAVLLPEPMPEGMRQISAFLLQGDARKQAELVVD